MFHLKGITGSTDPFYVPLPGGDLGDGPPSGVELTIAGKTNFKQLKLLTEAGNQVGLGDPLMTIVAEYAFEERVQGPGVQEMDEGEGCCAGLCEPDEDGDTACGTIGACLGLCLCCATACGAIVAARHGAF